MAVVKRYSMTCPSCGTRHIAASSRARFCSVACRFWSHVDRTGGDEACWPWRSAVRKTGYGLFFLDGPKSAHRIAWELTFGSIPVGDDPRDTSCLHRCDNPICCNPSHLWIGTTADNNRDKAEKGRGRTSDRRGERSPTAKLTEAQVIEIRSRLERGDRVADIAHEYGVIPRNIRHIQSRATWGHVS